MIEIGLIVPKEKVKCLYRGKAFISNAFLKPPESCFLCLNFDMLHILYRLLSKIIPGLAPSTVNQYHFLDL